MWANQLIEISKALLTPVIAIVATYIAWQQWRTNKQKLDLDRYDRRLRVYEEVKKILSLIARQGHASYEDLMKFRANAAEADFLFGPEIMKYIDDIYKRGVNLEMWWNEYRDATQEHPPGYDHKAVVEGKFKELSWLVEQFDVSRTKFHKYLHVGN